MYIDTAPGRTDVPARRRRRRRDDREQSPGPHGPSGAEPPENTQLNKSAAGGSGTARGTRKTPNSRPPHRGSGAHRFDSRYAGSSLGRRANLRA